MSNMNVTGPTGTTPTAPTEAPSGTTPTSGQFNAQDLKGVTNAGTTQTGPKPTLTAPKMSPAAMMIALTALNNKIAQEGIAFGESTMEGVRKDIKSQGAKRAEQVRKHFDEMDKAASKKKCGLFGAIANFFKKVFQGDIKGAFKTLADNFVNILKDVVQVVIAVALVVAAVAITAATAGGGAGTIALACVAAGLILGGMAMSDPGLQALVLDLMPDGAAKTAIGIALSVVGAVMGIAGGIITGVATGGLGMASSFAAVTGAVTGLINAGCTLANGIDDFVKSGHQQEATRIQADIDDTSAVMEQLKTFMARNQKDLQALFDMFANILQGTRDMITTQGQNQARAASV